MNMNTRDLQDRTNYQDRTNHQEAGQDRFSSWTQQASNDATDFFRSQSRGRTPDRMAQNMLDSLEITPLFVSINNTSDHGSHSNSRNSRDDHRSSYDDHQRSHDGHRDSHDGHRHAHDDHRNSMNGERITIDLGIGGSALVIDTVRDRQGHSEVQLISLLNQRRPEELNRTMPYDRHNSPSPVRDANNGDTRQPRPLEFAPTPPGFDGTKWNNGHDTPKYFVGHLVADMLQQDLLNPDREGQKARVEQFLKKQVPLLAARGIEVQKVSGEKMLVELHDGTGAHWVDTVVDVSGKNPHASWQVEA